MRQLYLLSIKPVEMEKATSFLNLTGSNCHKSEENSPNRRRDETSFNMATEKKFVNFVISITWLTGLYSMVNRFCQAFS